jgi:hypothetical protein
MEKENNPTFGLGVRQLAALDLPSVPRKSPSESRYDSANDY